MKLFSIGIDDALWAKFEDSFRATKEDYLVDGEGEPLKDPSPEDIATAEANAAAETERRGKQWLNVFVVNGIRERVMPEANAKAADDEDTVALEGLALRKTLQGMTAQVEKL